MGCLQSSETGGGESTSRNTPAGRRASRRKSALPQLPTGSPLQTLPLHDVGESLVSTMLVRFPTAVQGDDPVAGVIGCFIELRQSLPDLFQYRAKSVPQTLDDLLSLASSEADLVFTSPDSPLGTPEDTAAALSITVDELWTIVNNAVEGLEILLAVLFDSTPLEFAILGKDGGTLPLPAPPLDEAFADIAEALARRGTEPSWRNTVSMAAKALKRSGSTTATGGANPLSPEAAKKRQPSRRTSSGSSMRGTSWGSALRHALNRGGATSETFELLGLLRLSVSTARTVVGALTWGRGAADSMVIPDGTSAKFRTLSSAIAAFGHAALATERNGGEPSRDQPTFRAFVFLLGFGPCLGPEENSEDFSLWASTMPWGVLNGAAAHAISSVAAALSVSGTTEIGQLSRRSTAKPLAAFLASARPTGAPTTLVPTFLVGSDVPLPEPVPAGITELIHAAALALTEPRGSAEALPGVESAGIRKGLPNVTIRFSEPATEAVKHALEPSCSVVVTPPRGDQPTAELVVNSVTWISDESVTLGLSSSPNFDATLTSVMLRRFNSPVLEAVGNSVWFNGAAKQRCSEGDKDTLAMCSLLGSLAGFAITHGTALPIRLPLAMVQYLVLNDASATSCPFAASDLIEFGPTYADKVKKVRETEDQRELTKLARELFSLHHTEADRLSTKGADALLVKVLVSPILWEEGSMEALQAARRGFLATAVTRMPHVGAMGAAALRSAMCGGIRDDGTAQFEIRAIFDVRYDEESFAATVVTKAFRRIVESIITDSTAQKGSRFRRALIRFVTGTDRLPAWPRSKKLHIIVTPATGKDGPTAQRRLPTASTCDTTLFVPDYLGALLAEECHFRPQTLSDDDISEHWMGLMPHTRTQLKDRATALLKRKLDMAIVHTSGVELRPDQLVGEDAGEGEANDLHYGYGDDDDEDSDVEEPIEVAEDAPQMRIGNDGDGAIVTGGGGSSSAPRVDNSAHRLQKQSLPDGPPVDGNAFMDDSDDDSDGGYDMPEEQTAAGAAGFGDEPAPAVTSDPQPPHQQQRRSTGGAGLPDFPPASQKPTAPSAAPSGPPRPQKFKSNDDDDDDSASGSSTTTSALGSSDDSGNSWDD